MRRTEAEVYRSALGKHGRWGFLVLVALLPCLHQLQPHAAPHGYGSTGARRRRRPPLFTRTQSLGQLETILHRGERALTAGDLTAASAAEAQIGADLKLQAEASTLSPALALRRARLRSALAFTQGDTLRSAAAPPSGQIPSSAGSACNRWSMKPSIASSQAYRPRRCRRHHGPRGAISRPCPGLGRLRPSSGPPSPGRRSLAGTLARQGAPLATEESSAPRRRQRSPSHRRAPSLHGPSPGRRGGAPGWAPSGPV